MITIRLAEYQDLGGIMQLEEESFGFDPSAMAPQDMMAHRISILNTIRPGWFWVAEERGKILADLILQPTNLEPTEITSWAASTDDGRLEKTFNAEGRNLFVVSFASLGLQPAAIALLGHQGLVLWLSERKRALMFCSRMPGFESAHKESNKITPEEYCMATRPDGTPRDWLLKEFYELVASKPYRLLKNGYPPDKASGGHGVLFAATNPVAALQNTAFRIYRAGISEQREKKHGKSSRST